MSVPSNPSYVCTLPGVVLSMYDGALFVVYLFLFLIAEQQHDTSEQEDGSAPSNAVRPPKLPQFSVTCGTWHCNSVCQ